MSEPGFEADAPDAREAPDPREGSSALRAFEIVELFSPQLPVLRVEDITQRLGYTRSTAYRYLKQLCGIGLVAPSGGGFYALGPRIVELDRLMQVTDPLLQAGQAVMPGLAARHPGSIVLLCSLYRDKVLCIHKEGAAAIESRGRSIPIARARGLPLPLFRGAASLAILAFLPAHRLRSLFLDFHPQIAAAGLGDGWAAFKARLAEFRRPGHIITVGQNHPDMAAVALPIRLAEDGQVLGSLTRILAREDYSEEVRDSLVAELAAGAATIAERLPSKG
jgi:DNA-binding IclR family transcriptional regulator